MMHHLKVQLPTCQLSIPLSSRQTVTELLQDLHHPLNTRCGQKGLCQGCNVELLEGELVHRHTGQVVKAGNEPISLRGCEYLAQANVLVRVPQRSILHYQAQIVTDFRVNIPAAEEPLCEQIAAAIDIGTTTVALMLVEPETGKILASAADFNKQMRFGEDVLTRINACADKPMIAKLQDAVLTETIVPLLRIAAGKAGVDFRRVRCLSVAGNTTMLHLLAGEDPTPMGVVPFTPAFLGHRGIELGALKQAGLDAQVHLLPGCSAYIGADIAAGILATGMVYDPGPTLLVDVGTNGEIALKVGDRLIACATAAGPAFEGAGMSSGMRAGAGAIAHVQMDRDPFRVKIETIGGSPPIGICGSAYVDFLAQARRAGLLSSAGRFTTAATKDAAELIIPWNGHGQALVLHRSSAQQVVVSELDIARLLQAKAAIAAGIMTLLSHEHLEASDIKTLYLAGGFGMHINVDSAIASGLLPGFTRSQIQAVGNTSLAGAYLSLLDRTVIPELERIGQITTAIELNSDPDFESCYIDHLSLPE